MELKLLLNSKYSILPQNFGLALKYKSFQIYTCYRATCRHPMVQFCGFVNAACINAYAIYSRVVGGLLTIEDVSKAGKKGARKDFLRASCYQLTGTGSRSFTTFTSPVAERLFIYSSERRLCSHSVYHNYFQQKLCDCVSTRDIFHVMSETTSWTFSILLSQSPNLFQQQHRNSSLINLLLHPYSLTHILAQ